MDENAGRDASAGAVAPVSYSVELGQEICRRVAGGASERGLTRGPGMPCRRTVAAWAEAYPEFGAALVEARWEARLEWARRSRSAEAGKLWRRAQRVAAGGRVGGQPSALTPEIAEAVLDRVAAGESVVSIGQDPGAPSAATIYKWARMDEGFALAYARARQVAADQLFDLAREIALDTDSTTLEADKLRVRVLRWQVAHMAPRKYGPWLLQRPGPDVFAG